MSEGMFRDYDGIKLGSNNTELTFLENWLLIPYYALQIGCEPSHTYTLNPAKSTQSAPVHRYGKANISSVPASHITSRKSKKAPTYHWATEALNLHPLPWRKVMCVLLSITITIFTQQQLLKPQLPGDDGWQRTSLAVFV